MELLFGGHAAWFTIPAIVGTGFFILRVVLMLVGGDIDDGAGGIDDVDLDLDDLDADASDKSFEIVSLQSVVTFAMGFGLGGLGAYRGSGLGVWPSVAIATVIGVGFVWVLAWMLTKVYRLQSSGNVSLRHAVGREAEVYVRVPGERTGSGIVRVVIDERMREYSALTEGGQIERGTRVRVTAATADNTLIVEPA